MDAEVPFLLLSAGAGTDEPPLAGVSDFRGRPVYRDTSGGWRSALFVSVLEVATNFANFGVSSNLITYLTGPLGHSNAAAAAAVNAWSGTASMMPLLGAFVADSWLGRYRSILLACTIYVLGYGMLTLASTLQEAPCLSLLSSEKSSSSHPSSQKVVFVYASLYLIAIAQGADKPCGMAFAADQFDMDHPKERAARSSLFNWFYFSMAIGLAVAVAAVGSIQENIGWGIGFGALCAVMLCAFAAFLAGTRTYRLYTPISNVEVPIVRLGRSLVVLAKNYCSNFFFFFSPKIHQQQQQQVDEDGDEMSKTEEARAVLRLLPIWVACLAYGMVFAQVSTLFNKQCRTLDLRIFGGMELPPAALRTFGPVSILLFVPIYDRVLVPALRRATGNPDGLTLLQRVGTGMAMSLLAVTVAALVESQRLATARDHGLVAGAAVPMSWAWLVPQYVIIGMADVFAVVGMKELFYDEMPAELRSLGLGLYWSVMGISSFMSGALISLIDHVTRRGGGDSWFADNLNRAHLDYFYWLLAGVSAAELVLYLHFATSYVYVRKRLHY